jgi:propanol-preferring alcohol dehydrogenase
MKAAVLKRFGAPLVVEEIADPRPGQDDAIVAIHACGIDGTDLKLLNGFGYTPDLPFVMGHETAGTVESVGANVTAFRPGDRVVTYNFLIPPKSHWFGTEREQLSPDMTGVIGVKRHPGGYAEKMRVDAHQLIKIPDSVAFRDAAVHCDAGLTAYHAVRRARVSAGETVLVIGVGGVGSFAVQYAKLAGARVIAAERTKAKRDWAKSLGADHAISDDAISASVREFTNRSGVECVLDIVGTEETFAAALDSVAVGSRIIVVGYTPDRFALAGKHLAQNEIEVIGSRCGPRTDLSAALALFAAGKIRSIVTDAAPLADVNAALAKLRDGNVLGRLVLEIASL